MLPCPAALETMASRVGANFRSCRALNSAPCPPAGFGGARSRVIALEIEPNLLGIGTHEFHQQHAACDQNRQHQPRQADGGVAGALRDDLGEPHHQRAQRDADQRAGGDEAEREAAHARRIHVGRGDAKLARRAHAHGEQHHAGDEPPASAPMAKPVAMLPSIVSPCPNRMPGLRPNLSVILPVG